MCEWIYTTGGPHGCGSCYCMDDSVPRACASLYAQGARNVCACGGRLGRALAVDPENQTIYWTAHVPTKGTTIQRGPRRRTVSGDVVGCDGKSDCGRPTRNARRANAALAGQPEHPRRPERMVSCNGRSDGGVASTRVTRSEKILSGPSNGSALGASSP
jgi:hypothetical protein